MTITLSITARQKIGKANERLAGTGMIPAVFYGPKEAATPIEVSARDFDKALKAAGESTVVVLQGVGEDKEVLIKGIDFDPVSGVVRHADFYVLEKGKLVTVHVPLEFTGESTVSKVGGNVVKVLHEIEVEAMPANLPHEIIVDISVLKNIDDQILVSDVVPPTGVTILTPGEEVVALAAAQVEEKVEEKTIADIEMSVEKGKKPEDAEAAEGEAAAE